MSVHYSIAKTNRFFSQKMEAKEPEKKMPSTAANAIILSPKVAVVEPIHLSAHSAFFFTHGTTEDNNNYCKQQIHKCTGTAAIPLSQVKVTYM